MSIADPQTAAVFDLVDSAHQLINKLGEIAPVDDETRQQISDWKARYWAAAEQAAKAVVEA